MIGRTEEESGQEVIEWDDGIGAYRSRLTRSLAADEVADVFVNYCRTGSVPDRYSLREIQL